MCVLCCCLILIQQKTRIFLLDKLFDQTTLILTVMQFAQHRISQGQIILQKLVFVFKYFYRLQNKRLAEYSPSDQYTLYVIDNCTKRQSTKKYITFDCLSYMGFFLSILIHKLLCIKSLSNTILLRFVFNWCKYGRGGQEQRQVTDMGASAKLRSTRRKY